MQMQYNNIIPELFIWYKKAQRSKPATFLRNIEKGFAGEMMPESSKEFSKLKKEMVVVRGEPFRKGINRHTQGLACPLWKQ